MTLPDTSAPDRLRDDWLRWRERRTAELADPTGWLSLTALHWLSPVPAPAGDLPGLWWADTDGIHVLLDGDTLTLDGHELTGRATVWTPRTGAAGDLRHGDRRLEPLARGPLSHGVRVRDPHAPALTAFTGVPVFDHDPAWRLTAAFTPAAAGERAETGSVALGVRHVQDVEGTLTLHHDGADHTLLVTGGGQVSFRDATNGRQTAAFRVLTVHPDPDGTVVVDLNRARNAPCAFSDHGTCPLPPAGNTLPFAVTAGERTPR